MWTNILYTWSFDDKKNRWTMWYIIALSIIIWLSIWGFLTRQYWMSFIVLLISWLIYFVENNSDDIVTITITTLGIKIWKGFYDFSKINSYSFIYNWENSIFLRLNLNKKWFKHIDLIVNNSITNELNQILPNFLKEQSKWEISISEKIIDKLKL
jgi:hypothetical protein